MVKTRRDNTGKMRVVKGDKSGLGGQYAPDPQKIADAKNKMEKLPKIINREVTLIDGTVKTLQFSDTNAVCLICGEEYEFKNPNIAIQYCDETLECAMDSGEHLQAV